MYRVEISFISDHHEAEENQNFGEHFQEDLGDEEGDMKSWEGLVFVFIPWSSIIYNLEMREASLPDVVVGIRNRKKWEQDGHRAPVHNLSQVPKTNISLKVLFLLK